MGCGGSKTKDSIDFRNVPPFPPNCPPPAPPKEKKNEFYNPDDYRDAESKACQVPPKSLDTYELLRNHLFGANATDLEKVRSIFVWLGNTDLNKSDPKAKIDDTPKGYIKLIQSGQGDLPTFFALLCRRAGVPCVMLDGLAKSAAYEAGDDDEEILQMKNRWNAVYVNGSWQIVHIYWGLMSLGNRTGNPKKTTGQSTTVKQLNEYFFLTDPEEFATRCYPDDEDWQLLEKPVSFRDFADMPYYRPDFFQQRMQIISPKKGKIRTKKGEALIRIKIPKDVGDVLRLDYNLNYHETDEVTDDEDDQGKGQQTQGQGQQRQGQGQQTQGQGQQRQGQGQGQQGQGQGQQGQGQPGLERQKSQKTLTQAQLDRYIFLNRKGNEFTFEITVPEVGVYLLDIGGDLVESQGNTDLPLICQFRLICNRAPDECEPFPDDPEVGWGPGPDCERIGLLPITHRDGNIYLEPQEQLEIRFEMLGDLEVKTQMLHNYLPRENLRTLTSVNIDDGECRIATMIPQEGLYALRIFAKEKGGRGEFVHVCNYLLRQDKNAQVSEKIRNRMLRSRLDEAIRNGTQKDLTEAIDMFLCYNVPDQGELERAVDKMEYWQIRTDLRESVRRRHTGVIEKAIQSARNSRYENDLQDEIEKAEDSLQKLSKVDAPGRHRVQKTAKNSVISEIKSYAHPQPVVHDVMKASYILVGEKEDSLKDWNRIQKLLAQNGKESLVYRMQNEEPSNKCVELADVILRPYNLKETREASNGAASFYIWSKQIIKTSRDKREEEIKQQQEELAAQMRNRRVKDSDKKPGGRAPPRNAEQNDKGSPRKDTKGNKDSNDKDQKGPTGKTGKNEKVAVPTKTGRAARNR